MFELAGTSNLIYFIYTTARGKVKLYYGRRSPAVNPHVARVDDSLNWGTYGKLAHISPECTHLGAKDARQPLRQLLHGAAFLRPSTRIDATLTSTRSERICD